MCPGSQALYGVRRLRGGVGCGVADGVGIGVGVLSAGGNGVGDGKGQGVGAFLGAAWTDETARKAMAARSEIPLGRDDAEPIL